MMRFDPAIAGAISYTVPPRRAALYPAQWAGTASPRRIDAAAPYTVWGARSCDIDLWYIIGIVLYAAVKLS